MKKKYPINYNTNSILKLGHHQVINESLQVLKSYIINKIKIS